MEKIVKKVTDNVVIVEANSYDKERGYEFCIAATSNGWQWSIGHAFGKETAALLRDALDDVIHGRRLYEGDDQS